MIELVYADTAPSLNRIGTRGNRWAVNAAKKRWQAIFAVLLLEQRAPRGLRAVSASASLRFPTSRRRDVDNHQWLLAKALGDALVAGCFIRDDTPDCFRFDELTFEAATGPKRTTVRLEFQP